MHPIKLQIKDARATSAGKPLSDRTVVATQRGSLVGHGEHGFDSVVMGKALPDQKAVDAAHDAIHAHAASNNIELTGRRTV